MNQKYSKSQRDAIIEEHLKGAPVKQLAEKHGISKSTIYSWISQYDVMCRKCNPVSKELKDKMRIINRQQKIIHILQTAPCSASAPIGERVEFVKSHISEEYNVSTLCEAMNISRGTYFNRILRNKNDEKEYLIRRRELFHVIESIYHEYNQIYGAGKIAAVMKNRGYRVTEQFVASLMHENGLFSIRQCAKTLYEQNRERIQNLVNQKFIVSRPNEVWVSDVTFFKYEKKTYYVCVIIDLYARKVIGYQISTSNSTQLVRKALKIAYDNRQPETTLTFHSDQGANYNSKVFRRYLKSLNIIQSMSRKGMPYDNSVCESFFANMKREELYRRDYSSVTDLYQSIHKYMLFYNTERKHSLLRYMTPDKYEELYYSYNQTQTKPEMTGSDSNGLHNSDAIFDNFDKVKSEIPF